VKRLALLLLLAGCSAGPPPYATSIGVLRPHELMTVRIARGTVSAYAPLVGQRNDVYTVEAFADPSSTPPAPRIRPVPGGIEVDAPALRSLLVRVPQGVDLHVLSGGGDINVTDISGDAYASTMVGNINMMLPGYASALVTGTGNISVTMGAMTWPRPLMFFEMNGDVDVSINENARFDVFMGTNDGTIFTDFGLHGTSEGSSERIVAPVNGGGRDRAYIETRRGAIRLLRLAPQY
jgi:hypothetical protein